MKKLLVIIITLITIISLCACSSNNKTEVVENNEEIIENNEEVVENEVISEENALYRDAKGIFLREKFNPQDETWEGASYDLRLNDDKCTFTYTDFNVSDQRTCDFTVDVYEEFLNMICSQNPEEYENKTDENGKIIYEIEPHIIGVYSNNKSYYLKDTSNISEIIEKFESFKELAEPVEQ